MRPALLVLTSLITLTTVLAAHSGAQTQPSAAAGGKTYQGQTLSLNFQSIEVRSLLQLLAHFSGFNIIVSDGVVGSTSLRVRDLPWDHVLDIIVQSRGLVMRHDGPVIWVSTRAEQAVRQRQELEGQQSPRRSSRCSPSHFGSNTHAPTSSRASCSRARRPAACCPLAAV
jgi:type II secretory pathway component HofQ